MFNDLFNFLNPESSLSWFALVILLVVFITGKVKEIKTRDKITEKLSKAKKDYLDKFSDIKPKEYIRLNDDYDGSQHFIHSVPGVLISIGIVATFIGIGLAINKVSELISSTEAADPMAMLDVLSIVAFKFQTSVYGIVLSLFFSSFVLKPHISKVQELYDKAVLNLYEIRPSQSSLITNLENASTKLQTTIKKFSIENGESNKRLVKSIDTLNSDLKQSNESMEIHLKKMSEKIEQSINSSLKRIDESFKHLEASQGDSQELLKESLEVLTSRVNSVMEGVEGSINTMNISIEEKLVTGIDNLNTSLDGSLDNLNEHMSKLSSNLNTLNEQKSEFNAEMNDINKSIENLSSLMSEILKNEFKNNLPSNGDFSSE